MIIFSGCKINLGLRVTRRRADGFHDIETLFYPVHSLCDIVEVLPYSDALECEPMATQNQSADCSDRPVGDDECMAKSGAACISRQVSNHHQKDEYTAERETACISFPSAPSTLLHGGVAFSQSGLVVDCPAEKNLCVRACRLMQERYGVGPVQIHLHKRIPFGAGLGGGSADAAAVLRGINEVFGLGVGVDELAQLAAELGSDMPFFIYDTPMVGRGRGEVLTPHAVDLSGLYLVMVKPDMGVSTAEAYSLINPLVPECSIEEIAALPRKQWSALMVNDFETSVFSRLPLLATIKDELYRAGALYSAMSGSGSTIFGLFETEPTITPLLNEHFVHCAQIGY